MKTINYSPIGNVYSDFNCEEKAIEFMKSNGTSIDVACNLFIYYCRVYVKESGGELRVNHSNQTSKVDKYGRISKPTINNYEKIIDRLMS